MGKQKRQQEQHPVMTPRYIGGVVVTRVPQGTSEADKARVMALSHQIAYDHSEHPEEWNKSLYYARKPRGNQNRFNFKNNVY